MFVALIGKEIVRVTAIPDSKVLFQNHREGIADRKNLGFFILGVPKINDSAIKVNIFDKNISYGSCSASVVDEKVDDDPVSVFRETASP